MKMQFVLTGVLVMILSTGSALRGQDDSTSQLVSKLATGANSLLVIDVAALKNSDLVTKEGWFETAAGKIESGMAFLPANTNQVAFASQMDFGQLSPAWTSGLLTMETAPTLTAISDEIGGRIEAVAGHDVVWSSSDMFIFDVSPQTLATYSPANRQMFAAWLTGIKENQSSMANNYLQETVASASAGTSVVMAFDLAHVVSPSTVLERARHSTDLEKNGIDAEQFSKLLGSLQGVQVKINVSTRIVANVEIDFTNNAQFVAPVAKKLILEVVEQHGIGIADLENWETKVAGNRISFSGDLNKSGLRRLISLFDMPEPNMTAAEQASTEPEQKVRGPAISDFSSYDPVSAISEFRSDDKGSVTKDYFDAVSSMIKELRDDIGTGGENSWKLQRWFRSYADKIDNLPIKNVDSDALNFGGAVSRSFRNLSLQLTTGRQGARVQDKNLMAYGVGSPAYRYRNSHWGYYGNGWGGWGYGYGNNRADAALANRRQTEADRRDIRQKARAAATDNVADTFVQLQDQEHSLKRELTEKYPDAF